MLPQQDGLHKVEVIVPAGRCRTTIRQASDQHHGAEGFHSRAFRQFLREVAADDHGLWLGTGDMKDDDRPTTRELKARWFSDRPEVLTKDDEKDLLWIDKHIIPLYQPIAKKCAGIIDGDHFSVYRNGMTSGQYIARRLKVPYLGERMAFVGLNFVQASAHEKRVVYTIHARHGTGGGTTHGADMNALQRQASGFIADLHLGGHTHKENIAVDKVLFPNNTFTRIKSKIVWYMRGGSFLDGYAQMKRTYVKRAEFKPLPVGWGQVDIFTGSIKSEGGNLQVIEARPQLIAY